MYFIRGPQNKILLRRLGPAPGLRDASLRDWNGDTRTEIQIHLFYIISVR